MLTEEENTIAKGCKSGKEQYQKQLYLEYGPVVQGVCHRYALNADEAKDLFQDIFVFILTHFNDFSKEDSLKGWIYRVSVNKAIDYYRKRVRYQVDSIEGYELANNTMAPFVPEVLSLEKLMEFVNELPHKFRVLFNMFELDGYSQKQISEMMDIPENRVRVYIFRAKVLLQKEIRKYLKKEEFDI